MRPLFQWLAALGVVVILAAILVPVQAGSFRGPKPPCLNNLKQLVTGAIMYADDNDGRAMPGSTWMDSVGPYIKTASTYTCPLVAKESKSYGYAMNRFLSEQKIGKLPDADKAHFIYETSTLGKNVNEFLPAFPIPGRHDGKTMIAYADGHARFFLTDAPKE